MKPTRAQLNLAATIYGLTILAQMDAGRGDQWGEKVRGRMVQRAKEQLARLGLGNYPCASETEAVALAMRLRPA